MKIPFIDIYICVKKGSTLRNNKKESEQSQKINQKELSLLLAKNFELKKRLSRWEDVK